LESDPDILAAPFRPTAGYAVEGLIRPAAIWGALDCVSYSAADYRARRFCLLGGLEAHQVRPVEMTERLVVVGWTRGVGRRSVLTASAMIDEDGAIVASARAVWVAVRHQWAVKTIARFVG
jgi:acyl-CoA thioesterase FadM